MKLKEALQGKLSTTELEQLRASFDVIGDVAIIEVPLELKKKQTIIGKTLHSLLKNVNVVAVKQGGHTGKYRRQPLAVVAGEKRDLLWGDVATSSIEVTYSCALTTGSKACSAALQKCSPG